MKKRPDRNIEIFSLSAIDLFAAAMGAFALLTIVLIPYYQKEVRERTPENAIADLARAAETSAVETEIKKKALEKKRSASAANVSDIKSQADKLLAELRAAEAALREKQAEAERAVVVPEPVAELPAPSETPKKALVSFRFLGMKTKKDDIVVALDMNKCMGGHEASIEKAVNRIVDSLQDNHRLKIVGFQQTDAGPRTNVWPSNGSLQRINGSTKNGANRFTKQLTGRFGGSASMLDAFQKMLEGPGESIFLVSDGLPNPRANGGLSPNNLARRITSINGGRKEIHTVVVGNYFDYEGTVEFMETLSQSNRGQFMALASPTKGVCD
jgi:hypothetical protein